MQVEARSTPNKGAQFGLEDLGEDLFYSTGVDDILLENNKRFVLFPINYHSIWNVYKRAEALFWTSEDINFTKDVSKFRSLPDKSVGELLNLCLAYLSLQNTFEKYPLEGYLCDEVQAPEARCVFGFFMMQKNIHMEMFSMLLTRIFDQDSTALSHLVSSIEVLPYLKLRCAFLEAYIRNPAVHFSIKLAAIAIMVSLCSKSMSIILLLVASNAIFDPKLEPQNELCHQSMPNLLYGLAKVNRDESVFLDFCILLLRENMKTRPKSEVINRLITSTVSMEFELLQNILNSSTVSENIVNVVKSTIMGYANEIAVRLDYPAPYPNNTNSLLWTKSYLTHILTLHQDQIETTNEKQVKVGPSVNKTAVAFSIDDDF